MANPSLPNMSVRCLVAFRPNAWMSQKYALEPQLPYARSQKAPSHLTIDTPWNFLRHVCTCISYPLPFQRGANIFHKGLPIGIQRRIYVTSTWHLAGQWLHSHAKHVYPARDATLTSLRDLRTLRGSPQGISSHL